MELIVINENKLKIMMSAPDMEKYGLDENAFHLSIIDTRKILDRIIHSSPLKTGFEKILPNEKILMQLYPEKTGGCELFVTRIPLCNEEDFISVTHENEERLLLPQAKAKQVQTKKTTITYSFKKLDSAIRAARELKTRRFSGESSLYRDDMGKYYLSTCAKRDGSESGKANTYDAQTLCLSEFGELENSETSMLHLIEHGKCILKENAVQTLSDI